GAHVPPVYARGEDGVSRELGGGLHDVALHELDALRLKVCELDGGHGGDGGGDLLKGQQEADVHDGLGYEFERELRDDAEGALGAYNEVEQAVAGAGLADGLAELQHLAAGEDNGHGEDVVAGDAVFDGAHASGVGADVAADGGGFLA